MCQRPQSEAEKTTELAKLQFDYAWKWFSYHADQRLKMFNYMLLVFGIFATAVVSTYDKHLPTYFSAGLCIVAAALAIAFSRLDLRNQQLVWLGEDVLIELERTIIFGDKVIDGRDGVPQVQFAILWRQERETQMTRNEVYGVFLPLHNLWSGKHRYLLRKIAIVIAAIFMLAGVWLLLNPAPIGK